MSLFFADGDKKKQICQFRLGLNLQAVFNLMAAAGTAVSNICSILFPSPIFFRDQKVENPVLLSLRSATQNLKGH